MNVSVPAIAWQTDQLSVFRNPFQWSIIHGDLPSSQLLARLVELQPSFLFSEKQEARRTTTTLQSPNLKPWIPERSQLRVLVKETRGSGVVNYRQICWSEFRGPALRSSGEAEKNRTIAIYFPRYLVKRTPARKSHPPGREIKDEERKPR